MPIGIASPARNLFLLGSTGASATQDFITRITPPANDSYGVSPTDILYEDTTQKIYLSGTQYDFTYAVSEGFIIRTTDGDTSRDIDLKLKGSSTNIDVTINAIKYDSNLNIFACGSTENFSSVKLPHLTKFDTTGQIEWSRSFASGGGFDSVEYRDLCVDEYDSVYVCGNNGDIAVVSKYDQYGTCLWTKTYEDTNSTWIAFKASSITVNTRGQLIVVGRVEATSKEKAFILKMSLDGQLIWSKTFEVTSTDYQSPILYLEDVYVDDSDQIYVVGYEEDSVTSETRSFIMRMTAEGNLMWQTRTDTAAFNVKFRNVSVDSLTGQSVVIGECNIGVNGFIILQRYSTFGKLIWSRKISSSNNRGGFANLFADPSYVYISYADELTSGSDPESFLFGKLSVTGSGLGAFEYADGQTTQDYVIQPLPFEVNTLYDGSMRMDISDFRTYPHSAINVMFGDISGGNMIYSDKKPVHDDATNDITSNSLTGTNVASHVLAEDIVRDNNLLLNYDFGNEFTYDRAENYFKDSVVSDLVDYNSTTIVGKWSFASSHGYVGPNVLSPAGDLTAASGVYDGTDSNIGGGVGFAQKDLTVSPINQVDLPIGETVTFSVYAKVPSTNNYVTGIYLRQYGPEFGVHFDLKNGVKGGFAEDSAGTAVSSSIENIGNGWYRCSITGTVADGDIGHQFYLINYGGNYTGLNNPDAAGEALYIWGPQLERGTTAGRYIETSGTAITAPTTVKNLSSSSYTGTINGATFNSAGYFVFDGSNDDISVSSLPAFADAGAITIESWANADTTTNTFQVIATAKGTTTHWQLSFTGDPTYNILWAFAGTANSVGTTTLPSTGAWHHITATYNGGDKTQLASWKVYIDGSEATIQLTGSTGSATNDTIIGHRSGGPTGNRFDGNIGEVRIYNRALTATEVSQNFNATRSKYGV